MKMTRRKKGGDGVGNKKYLLSPRIRKKKLACLLVLLKVCVYVQRSVPVKGR